MAEQFYMFYIAMILIAISAAVRSMKKTPITKDEKKRAQNELMKFMTKEELMDDKNYSSVYGDNQYIQNNTKPITREMSILTPSFDSDNFMVFAKNIFKRLVEAQSPGPLSGFVANDIDTTQLPKSLARYDVCYMHNYIVNKDMEAIKILFTIEADIKDNVKEKYFAVFSRRNPILSAGKGQVITVNCPDCGGDVKFGKSPITQCPYCGSAVAFAEYDWNLSEVERINDDTVIMNRAITKGNTD